MVATYNLCKKLIAIGKADIVNANIDVYLANNRLIAEEYNEITALLSSQEAK